MDTGRSTCTGFFVLFRKPVMVVLRPRRPRALSISRNLPSLKLLNLLIKTYCTWSLHHQPQSSKTLREPASQETRRSSTLVATLLFIMVFPLQVCKVCISFISFVHSLPSRSPRLTHVAGHVSRIEDVQRSVADYSHSPYLGCWVCRGVLSN